VGQTNNSVDWLDQLGEDMDLRRRREHALTDRIVKRAQWLEPIDRQLVLAMFRDGQSAQSIANRFGGCPRHIRRRIKKLVHRLNDPRLAYVVAHHEKWTKSRRSIARCLFIQGRSMRETTQELGMSFYSVRKHREAIDAMCQAAINAGQMRTWR